MRRTKERKLNFKQLLLLTLTLHFVRVRCAGFDVLSLSLNKERTKENQPRRSPWEPPGIAALQREEREITYKPLVLCLAFSHHERQAGKARAFAKTNPSWARAYAPKMEEACEGKKTTALKKPSGGGVPRGVPLVPFLATSWGMPRSSINLPAARCAADQE